MQLIISKLIVKIPLQSIVSAQNRKQTDTSGLAKFLELKIGPKVMITVNIVMKIDSYRERLARSLHLSLLIMLYK